MEKILILCVIVTGLLRFVDAIEHFYFLNDTHEGLILIASVMGKVARHYMTIHVLQIANVALVTATITMVLGPLVYAIPVVV